MTVEPRNILALVPNWLGDVAMCTPALRALRTRFPEARLTVGGRASACALLEGLPWFERLEVLRARPGARGTLQDARRLRPYSRDLAVIFPHSFRAALLARLAGARRRVGYDRDNRRWLLTDPVPPYMEDGRIQPVYMAREYLDLLASLGCVDDGQGLELAADSEAAADVTRRLDGDGPRVGIAPGAAFGPSKRWPAERFAAAADALAEAVGAQCVLITGPGEEGLRAEVLAAARTPLQEFHGPGGPDIKTLKAVVSRLDLLVGNDSGPRHVAVAFRVPTVCIMGPTSPRYSVGPYERGCVLEGEADCRPCQQPVCPTSHQCMTSITPGRVVDAALAILRTRAAPM